MYNLSAGEGQETDEDATHPRIKLYEEHSDANPNVVKDQ